MSQEQPAPRVKCANIYPKTVVRPQKADAWKLLNPSILSEEGKTVVNEDPDLNEKTIQKLLALGKDSATGANLFLDEDECDEKLASIGRALISICIKDDLCATWAEFAARVAATYRFPFLATVLVLRTYVRKYGAFVLYKNGSRVATQWLPKKARIENTDFSRRTHMGEDWQDIA